MAIVFESVFDSVLAKMTDNERALYESRERVRTVIATMPQTTKYVLRRLYRWQDAGQDKWTWGEVTHKCGDTVSGEAVGAALRELERLCIITISTEQRCKMGRPRRVIRFA